MPGYVRSSRRFMTNSSMPLISGESVPMRSRVCGPDWRRGWRCTTSVSGSTSSSDDLGWPSPTYWDGDLTIHTKRLRLRIARRALNPDCTLWVAGTHHIIFSLGFALQRSEPRQYFSTRVAVYTQRYGQFIEYSSRIHCASLTLSLMENRIELADLSRSGRVLNIHS